MGLGFNALASGNSDNKMISGKKVFERVLRELCPTPGYQTEERKSIFDALPGMLLDMLQDREVTAFHQQSDVAWVGVFTAHDFHADKRDSHLYYPQAALRHAFKLAIEFVDPKLQDEFLSAFDSVAARETGIAHDTLKPLDEYGRGAKGQARHVPKDTYVPFGRALG